MPKQSSKISKVLEELRSRLTEESLGELAAQILGASGGRKGGQARAEKLSPERRKEIARKAAEARWGKAQKNHSPPK